jgi:hypothetical protein
VLARGQSPAIPLTEPPNKDHPISSQRRPHQRAGGPMVVMGVMILGIVLFSILIPAGILYGRETIREYRKDIVLDLQKLFDFARTEDDKPIIIPSFELVKYKYAPPPDQDRSRASSRRSYLLSMSIYACTSALGMIALFWATLVPSQPASPPPSDLLQQLTLPFAQWPSVFLSAAHYFLPGSMEADIRTQAICIASFAFLGGYLFSITFLVRRVANFDLSPLSFFRASLHIFQGACLAVVLFHAAKFVDFPGMQSPLALGLAFLIGWFPDLGIQKIQAKFPSLRLKSVPKEARAVAYELPLELISGIDPLISYRLTEFEIDDVQNLATANPIQIFVETPYGLYEAIDWVAQAQLIVAVGVKKTVLLRDANIRTIFDLEKSLGSVELRRQMVKALFESPDEHQLAEISAMPKTPPAKWIDRVFLKTAHAQIDPCTDGSYPADPLTAIVCGIYDDMHVKRLRQICDVISDRLSERMFIRRAKTL